MIYDPLDPFFKSVTGAVREKERITFRIALDSDFASFVINKDGEDDEVIEMFKVDGGFKLTISLSCGLYFYGFRTQRGFIGKGKDFAGEFTNETERFQLTVFSEKFRVPDWVYGGIIYQIFPDRFYRSEKGGILSAEKTLHEDWYEDPYTGSKDNADFFGGNLQGVIEKLDYLRSLSVSVIYLNPIFKARSNHRYDTGDYERVDELLGSDLDLKQLIEEGEKRGIKIILDGVFNHTGDDSVYFNKYGNYDSVGAYQSRKSPYYVWYEFSDYPDEYRSWWGIKTLPAVRERSSFLSFIAGENGIIDRYTRLGIGGWRLDVVDELSDGFVRKIRTAVKRANPDGFIIGEVWEDATNKISYDVRRRYFQGKELDSVMNYPLKDAVLRFVSGGDAEDLLRLINEQIDHYPEASLHALMNVLSTHDTARLRSVFESTGEERAAFCVRAASLIQYTLPGIPSVFYGDEAGIDGGFDPINRRCYPWGKEDKNLVQWYRLLGKIRRDNNKVFKRGEFHNIYAKGKIFVYSRGDISGETAVAINVGDVGANLKFDGNLKDIIGGKRYNGSMELKPYSLAVLINAD